MAIAIDLITSEFVLLAIICGFLIRHYQSSLVTWDVTLTVYLSWVLGFAAVLLLPYDLSLAIVYNLQSTVLVSIWSYVYWG
ncbi:hypothetical protein EON65_36545 [archaeon]|nr:MAG: hypothetical protein EON65_36545 [archaeon]